MSEDGTGRRDGGARNQPGRNRTGWALTRRHRANRSPNAVDHYSLFLQVIQVFPVITSVALLIFSSAWLAKVISAILLVGGTGLVVVLEYGGERRRRAVEAVARLAAARKADPELYSGTYADQDAGTRTEIAVPDVRSVVTDEGDQHIVISIRVKSAPPAKQVRRRRRRPPSGPVT